MSGELVLAIAYGAVLVGSGAWIWLRVLKDYGERKESE